MKSFLAGLTACLLLAVVAMPASAQNQKIAGSAHDFSDELAGTDSWNTSGQLCVVCHTPHNASATVGSPLWNHTETNVPGTGGYTLYTNPATLNSTMTQPTGQSLLCLGCHDGTVALDNFGSAPATTTFIDDVNPLALVGSDLSNDHPVSFVYNTALATADGELYDPSTTTAVSDLLFVDRLECASCHDVHNNVPSGNTHLLRVTTAGSQLCFTCHNK